MNHAYSLVRVSCFAAFFCRRLVKLGASKVGVRTCLQELRTVAGKTLLVARVQGASKISGSALKG